MAKERIKPKGTVRTAVLKEFRYRCAVDGRDDAEIHHIDENPANNDPLNLIPLCTACHTVQHDPARAYPQEILRLYRRFKAPRILSAQFLPILERLRFLNELEQTFNADRCEEAVTQLLTFIRHLEMGEAYAAQISSLILRPAHPFAVWLGDPESERRYEESKLAEREEYKAQLIRNREAVLKLVVELLIFQNWLTPNDRAK